MQIDSGEIGTSIYTGGFNLENKKHLKLKVQCWMFNIFSLFLLLMFTKNFRVNLLMSPVKAISKYFSAELAVSFKRLFKIRYRYFSISFLAERLQLELKFCHVTGKPNFERLCCSNHRNFEFITTANVFSFSQLILYYIFSRCFSKRFHHYQYTCIDNHTRILQYIPLHRSIS